VHSKEMGCGLNCYWPNSTGRREVQGEHPCRRPHLSYEGVGGVGGRTGYLLLHSYWTAFDRHGVWIKLTLAKQYRKEGGAGGAPLSQATSGLQRWEYTGNYRNKAGNSGQPQSAIYPDGDM
jgi:hypothetical protein